MTREEVPFFLPLRLRSHRSCSTFGVTHPRRTPTSHYGRMTPRRSALAGLALVAALAVSATTLGPASAAESSPSPSPRPGCGAPPQHEVTASPRSISSGATTTVTVLRRLEPCYPDESQTHEVTLYAKLTMRDTAPTVVATGRTDSGGLVSFVLAPAETTDYSDVPERLSSTATRFFRVIVDDQPFPSPNCVSYALAVDRDAVVAGEPVYVHGTIRGDGNYDHKVLVQPAGYTRRPGLTALDGGAFTRLPGGGLPGSDGVKGARWSFTPTTSSRVWMSWSDVCHDGQTRAGATDERPLVVVAPRLTLTAQRHGPRDYTFRGLAVSRPDHVLSLYRLTAGGAEVLTARTRSTAAGTWSLRRSFLGSGEFAFVLRTPADQANAAGASNVRPTVIH